jgi:hypothetical protein
MKIQLPQTQEQDKKAGGNACFNDPDTIKIDKKETEKEVPGR